MSEVLRATVATGLLMFAVILLIVFLQFVKSGPAAVRRARERGFDLRAWFDGEMP